MILSSIVRNHVKKCLLRAADVSFLVSKGEEAAMQKRKFDGNEVACTDRIRNHQAGYHGDPGASLDRGANRTAYTSSIRGQQSGNRKTRRPRPGLCSPRRSGTNHRGRGWLYLGRHFRTETAVARRSISEARICSIRSVACRKPLGIVRRGDSSCTNLDLVGSPTLPIAPARQRLYARSTSFGLPGQQRHLHL
jgi:hypothetical protein